MANINIHWNVNLFLRTLEAFRTTYLEISIFRIDLYFLNYLLGLPSSETHIGWVVMLYILTKTIQSLNYCTPQTFANSNVQLNIRFLVLCKWMETDEFQNPKPYYWDTVDNNNYQWSITNQFRIWIIYLFYST